MRIRMRTFVSADAKNRFGVLIDTAQAAPVAITKSDRRVAVILPVEEYDRLKTIESEHRAKSPHVGEAK